MKKQLLLTLLLLSGCCAHQKTICCDQLVTDYHPVIHFEHNRSDLDSKDQHILQHLSDQIAHCPNLQIHITGYTDNTGTSDYNKTLGTLRAQTTEMYLENLGIHTNRMHIQSKGEQDPVANNDTEHGRSQNRRVMITFTNTSN